MYAGLIVCALLGVTFQIIVDVIERVLMPWKPR
jgi:ABC-type nitrate/sulfonate/bicarbonate transport system permease component